MPITNRMSQTPNGREEIEKVFPGVAPLSSLSNRARIQRKARQLEHDCQRCDMSVNSHGIIIAARGDTCNKTNGRERKKERKNGQLNGGRDVRGKIAYWKSVGV